MPQNLAPLPEGAEIVDGDRSPTAFFRLLWQMIRDSMVRTPTEARISGSGQTAALATTTIRTTTLQADYEVGYYIRKTTADGVSSSLTVTLGWTENGVAQTRAFAALATDTTGANQSAVIPILADAATDITIAIAYASNTPGTMVYLYRAAVKRLA